MNCDRCQENIMDMLYGEDFDPRASFEFFQHLAACSGCNGEYKELLQTRERLSEWKLEDPPGNSEKARPAFGSSFLPGRIHWWGALQKIAAAFLIVVGGLSVLHSFGYLGGRRLVVTEQQLKETVHDLIIEQQTEERQLMLRALLTVKEDLELQRHADRDGLQRYLVSLEQRYVENMEENNQYLRTLLSR